MKKPIGKNCLIFDLDGTIIETVETELEMFLSSFFETFGVDKREMVLEAPEVCDSETDYGLFGSIYRSYFGKLPTDGEKTSFLENYYEKYTGFLSASPKGVTAKGKLKETLEKIKQNEEPIQLGLLSGNFTRVGYLKLGELNISSYFDFIAFSDSFEKKKDLFNHLVNNRIFSPAEVEVTYVGDTIRDLEFSHDVGINFIGVESKSLSTAELADDLKITNSFEKIINYIGVE